MAVPPKDKFCTQTIEGLVQCVTGGASGSGLEPIGKYRSGPEIVGFLAESGIDCTIGTRVPSVRDALRDTNGLPTTRPRLVTLLEQVSNPAEYLDFPDRGKRVVDYLNERLHFDGLELRREGTAYRVRSIGTAGHAAQGLATRLESLNFASVEADFTRALEQAEKDPPGAVTSACSIVESVCKCLLDELNEPYPTKEDVQNLVRATARRLKLDPARTDLPPQYEADIRQVLSGLQTVANGVGALRTHSGDAHGRGKSPYSIDARIARLAIHAASTISLFFIETWQRTTD